MCSTIVFPLFLILSICGRLQIYEMFQFLLSWPGSRWCLTFLCVLNDSKGIMVVNSMRPGGGAFLGLWLHSIWLWRLLTLFSPAGLQEAAFVAGSRQLKVKGGQSEVTEPAAGLVYLGGHTSKLVDGHPASGQMSVMKLHLFGF